MTPGRAEVLALLILGFPLLGAALNALAGPRLGRRFCNIAGTLSILAAFVVACLMLAGTLSAPESQRSVTAHIWQWLDLGAGNLAASFDVTIDPLACVMVMVITGVGFLIHVYSIGYMERERDIARFFSYMNFFVFSMLLLVLSADLIFLLFGWALVALSSYLLIAYHYERPSAVIAGRKAFITQVIGDVAMVIAAFLIVGNLHGPGGGHIVSLSLPVIFANASSFPAGGALIAGICLLLAVGAFAKSAQFPLHTWLPDAMEGPTPVSALIHAATMVTAGVYLIARFHPLFDRSDLARDVVAIVGMGTAVMAGIIALSQIDIKRVIAYSTMSQIGLMIYATGIGAYSAGMYHLTTHAIFKALLFMAAGNVIHALHDEQDIRLMGGLASRMRLTELSFLSGSFALAGIPFFAGWFSKEGLLGSGVVNGPGSAPWVLYLVGIALNVLTGLYAFRLWAIVFRGTPQTARVYAAHEARKVMLVPVAILAALAAGVAIFLQWPVNIAGFTVNDFGTFLAPTFARSTIATEPSTGIAWLALVVGTVASLAGVGGAVRLWLQRRPDAAVVASRLPRVLTQLSLRKFYFDEIYAATLVAPTRSLGRALRRVGEPRIMDGWVQATVNMVTDLGTITRSWQTGLIRDYASLIVVAAGVLVAAVVVVIGH